MEGRHSKTNYNPSTVTAATSNSDDPSQLQQQECDPKVWELFNSSFSEAQSALDRNRVLIQQVNENHQSKIADNMVKNVALIQEINHNISKVASLYSDLSTNFSSTVHHQKSSKQGSSRYA